MKPAILLLLAGIILVSGCTGFMTCEQYCPTQPHIQCVGHWEISGSYPDCNCSYICDVQEPPTCEQYCQDQPHIQCTGEWNISGEYPDCTCEWICEREDIRLTARPGDGLCDYHEAVMYAGDQVTVYINDVEHRVNVTRISSQDMVTVVVDGFFTYTFAQLDRFASLNNVGLRLKEVVYPVEGEDYSVIVIGENRVNSPSDCYGIE